MANIPDAPWIRETEATGCCSYGFWNQPAKDERTPVCPVCGEEADEFYKNKDGEIVGCFNCITKVDAWECVSEEDDYDEEDDFGGEDDVFYGNETTDF